MSPVNSGVTAPNFTNFSHDIQASYLDLPPWLSGLAISGRGAVKAWLAIR